MTLIERLEAAEVGSRELDRSIWRMTGGWNGVNAPPPYTTSLDAALALAERVLPGWDWSVTTITTSFGGVKKVNAIVAHPDHPAGEDINTFGEAPNPALALCIAILKAKETK